MSNDDATITDEPGTDNLAELREAAKLGKVATARTSELEREIAMLRAGVDTESPVGKLFVKAYDGELTTEAVAAAATAVGAIKNVEAPAADPELTPEQQAIDDTRDRLNGNRSGDLALDDGEGPDPLKHALETFQIEKLSIGTENAQHHALASVIQAAARGDKRAIFDPVAHARAAAEYPSDPQMPARTARR
jgi:hypothetical protein